MSLVSCSHPNVLLCEGVWYIMSNLLVVLSKQVWKTGDQVRLLGLKIPCDLKVAVTLSKYT